MNTTRDKYLTEAMGGRTDCKCTVDGEHDNHDDCWIISNPAERCCETPESHLPEDCKYWDHLYDFSTWQGFGKLKEYISTKDHRLEFWIYYLDNVFGWMDEVDLIFDNITPDILADNYYEFLKGREA